MSTWLNSRSPSRLVYIPTHSIPQASTISRRPRENENGEGSWPRSDTEAKSASTNVAAGARKRILTDSSGCRWAKRCGSPASVARTHFTFCVVPVGSRRSSKSESASAWMVETNASMSSLRAADARSSISCLIACLSAAAPETVWSRAAEFPRPVPGHKPQTANSDFPSITFEKRVKFELFLLGHEC